jgi:hypothetical protein
LFASRDEGEARVLVQRDGTHVVVAVRHVRISLDGRCPAREGVSDGLVEQRCRDAAPAGVAVDREADDRPDALVRVTWAVLR